MEIQKNNPPPWAEEPFAELCECIVNYLLREKSENLAMLSFANFARECNLNTADKRLLESILFLCSAQANILQMLLFYIDEDDTPFEISYADYIEAQKCGILHHPETGESIGDYKEHIRIFFQPTDQLIRTKQ